jgi:hypothetical protein
MSSRAFRADPAVRRRALSSYRTVDQVSRISSAAQRCVMVVSAPTWLTPGPVQMPRSFCLRGIRRRRCRNRTCRERPAQILHVDFQSADSFLQIEEIITSRIIHPLEGLLPKPPSRQQPLQHYELLLSSRQATATPQPAPSSVPLRRWRPLSGEPPPTWALSGTRRRRAPAKRAGSARCLRLCRR